MPYRTAVMGWLRTGWLAALLLCLACGEAGPHSGSDVTPSDATNPELLAAMRAHHAPGAGEDSFVRILQALIASRLLVPIPVIADAEDGLEEDEDGQIDLLTQETTSGTTALPVFTDDASLRRLLPAAESYAEVNCTTLFQLALAAGIDHVVLNAGSPAAVAVDRPHFEALAEERVPALH